METDLEKANRYLALEQQLSDTANNANRQVIIGQMAALLHGRDRRAVVR